MGVVSMNGMQKVPEIKPLVAQAVYLEVFFPV
jgi:hypothetical protein